MELEHTLLDADRSEKFPATSNGAAGLSAIADEIEAYLGQWLSRLEGVLEQYGDGSTDDGALEARMAEFEEEKRSWNLHRQQEMQQMQETAEQLTAAWARLENEQRRLLQAQESLQVRATTASNSTDDAARVSSPAEPTSGEDAASVSRELAVRQFQQLRRQMGISGETP